MVLHSAAHLFQDGELNGGLRDLVDLDSLLRHFGSDENFWGGLVSRAQTMDLERPLYYALRYCEQWLGTPVPDTSTLKRPRTPARAIMDALTRHGGDAGWLGAPLSPNAIGPMAPLRSLPLASYAARLVGTPPPEESLGPHRLAKFLTSPPGPDTNPVSLHPTRGIINAVSTFLTARIGVTNRGITTLH